MPELITEEFMIDPSIWAYSVIYGDDIFRFLLMKNAFATGYLVRGLDDWRCAIRDFPYGSMGGYDWGHHLRHQLVPEAVDKIKAAGIDVSTFARYLRVKRSDGTPIGDACACICWSDLIEKHEHARAIAKAWSIGWINRRHGRGFRTSEIIEASCDTDHLHGE